MRAVNFFNLKTDQTLLIILTFLAVGTRWFFFQGQVSVPFEIQDEIALVWELKHFLLGDWDNISNPVIRFVAGFALVPFFAIYFLYGWLIGDVSSLTDVVDSFFLHTANANALGSVWIWVPRFVSWLCLTVSVPLQFVLTKRLTGNRIVAFMAGVIVNFSFTALYLSIFGLPDSLGFLVFQIALLVLVSHVRNRTTKTTIMFCVAMAVIILVRLQNALVLGAAGILYLVIFRVQEGNKSWKSILKEILVLAGGTVIWIIVINPVTYLAPNAFLQEYTRTIVGEYVPLSNVSWTLNAAYISRVVFDEILGMELTLLLGAAVIALYLRRSQENRCYYLLVSPLMFLFIALGYIPKLTYETNLVTMLVPASILAAWVMSDSPRIFEKLHWRGIRSFGVGLMVIIFGISQIRPIQNWLSLYGMSLNTSTRASARHWIHENIPSGSTIYIGSYTYTAPLITSMEQLQREAPDSELLRWRTENDVSMVLSPNYYLITDLESSVEQGIVPEYYVQASFAQKRISCRWGGIWGVLLCPYNPLRGSLPYFSQLNDIPADSRGFTQMLLSEFNPICPQHRHQTVFINYRTNVLRNNVQHLCKFGPIIRVYQLEA